MLLKPSQIEGKITLTLKERAAKRKQLYYAQGGICACGCGRPMLLDAGYFGSATLDHITPEPAGCPKRDNDDNLRAIRWECNSKKGSRRDT